MNYESGDDFIRLFQQQVDWFCDKLMVPSPANKNDMANTCNRMISVGWLRQSEYETYLTLTKTDDDD